MGPCNTFLARLGRKADFNFLRAMSIKKGSPPLTQVTLTDKKRAAAANPPQSRTVHSLLQLAPGPLVDALSRPDDLCSVFGLLYQRCGARVNLIQQQRRRGHLAFSQVLQDRLHLHAVRSGRWDRPGFDPSCCHFYSSLSWQQAVERAGTTSLPSSS